MSGYSQLEERLLLHLLAARQAGTLAGMPEREWRFDPSRRWRFDLAWPPLMLAVEVEGGTRQYGRHNRAAGYAADLAKYNRAAILGWTVLRYDAEMVRSGEAAREIVAALTTAMAAR